MNSEIKAALKLTLKELHSWRKNEQVVPVSPVLYRFAEVVALEAIRQERERIKQRLGLTRTEPAEEYTFSNDDILEAIEGDR